MKPVFPPSVDMMLHEWLWRKRSRACDRLPQIIPFLASTSRVQPCGPWKLNYDEALGERKDERQQGNSQATRSFAKHKGLNDCMDWHQRLHNKASAVPSVNLQAPWSSAPPRPCICTAAVHVALAFLCIATRSAGVDMPTNFLSTCTPRARSSSAGRRRRRRPGWDGGSRNGERDCGKSPFVIKLSSVGVDDISCAAIKLRTGSGMLHCTVCGASTASQAKDQGVM